MSDHRDGLRSGVRVLLLGVGSCSAPDLAAFIQYCASTTVLSPLSMESKTNFREHWLSKQSIGKKFPTRWLKLFLGLQNIQTSILHHYKVAQLVGASCVPYTKMLWVRLPDQARTGGNGLIFLSHIDGCLSNQIDKTRA